MKRVIAFLLLFCLLAVGCDGAAMTSSEQPVIQPIEGLKVVGDPTSVTLVNGNFFDGGNEEYAAAWKENMSAGGVTFNVVVPQLAQDQTLADYILAQDGSLDGAFVYVSDYETLAALITAQAVVPLDKYLKDDEVYASLSADFTGAYSINGYTWAIPADGAYVLPWTRSWRSSALGEGAGLAEDVETLKTTLAAVKGKQKYALYSVGASGFYDVFAAFGAPLADYTTPIGYQKQTGNVIDAMLCDGAREALEYLRELYAQGLINPDFSTNSYDGLLTALKKGEVTTAVYPLGAAKFVAGPALYGSNAAKTEEYWAQAKEVYTESGLNGVSVPITVSGGGYVLLKGGTQPAECVKYLLKTLWGSEESWLKCSVGISGYTLTDGGIQLEYISDKNHSAYPMPNLCGTLAGSFDAQKYPRFFSDTSDMTKLRAADYAAYLSQTIADGLQSGEYYWQHPLFSGINSAEFSASSQQVEQLFATLLESAITDTEVTVEQALAEYRSGMAALNGDLILAQANEALGLFSTQT